MTPSLVQNLAHLGLYALLSLLWAWTLDHARLRLPAAFAIAAGFGALLEWLQTGVPGRFGSPIDIGLNTIGALLGLLASHLESRRRRP